MSPSIFTSKAGFISLKLNKIGNENPPKGTSSPDLLSYEKSKVFLKTVTFKKGRLV